MKKSQYILGLAIIASSSLSAAENLTTVCKSADNIREISIVYPEGTQTPCEVHYTKKGETKVLWSAKAESGYCESKAADFIEKQKDWGWQCEQVVIEGDVKVESPENSESVVSEELEETSTDEDSSL
ncbi:hypothetical protein [Aliikangiella sp. G2MR2-5]|uniref:hypothetical protein n=1 Tax=Aliikangiella sp. G2MR2-5 TaxID=2788943 RepID=UPI0018AA4622|nr:hypothetical protein [Aliikangiella sp. G2MR2-5]